MRPMTGLFALSLRRRLRAASLLEAVVAAVLFLTLFAAVMELIPRLTVRGETPCWSPKRNTASGGLSKNTAPGCGPAANMPRRMVGVR